LQLSMYSPRSDQCGSGMSSSSEGSPQG